MSDRTDKNTQRMPAFMKDETNNEVGMATDRIDVDSVLAEMEKALDDVAGCRADTAQAVSRIPTNGPVR